MKKLVLLIAILGTGFIILFVWWRAAAKLPDGWRTYKDPDGAFMIAYPPGMEPVEPEEPFYQLADPQVMLYTEAASYRRPNYSQSGWVAVSSEPESDACYTKNGLNAAAPLDLDKERAIGGKTFRFAEIGSAAAGTSYETSVYRTVEDGRCFEIATTLRTSSDWTEVDMDAARRSEEEMRALLESVVQTFRFK